MSVPINRTRGRSSSRRSSRPNSTSGSTSSIRTRPVPSRAHLPTWNKRWSKRRGRPRDRGQRMYLTVPRPATVAGDPSPVLGPNASARPQRNLIDIPSSHPLQLVSSMTLLRHALRGFRRSHRACHLQRHPAQRTQQAQSIRPARRRHLDAPPYPPGFPSTILRTSLSLSSLSKSPARWRSAAITTPSD